MSFFDSIKSKFNEMAARRKEESERLNRLRSEANKLEEIEFEKEFIRSAKELAIARAKKDAAKKTGLAKFRALERAERLQSKTPTSGFASKLQKFAAYSAHNRERTERNREIVKKKREMARKMQQERLEQAKKLRDVRMKQREMVKKARMEKILSRKKFGS